MRPELIERHATELAHIILADDLQGAGRRITIACCTEDDAMAIRDRAAEIVHSFKKRVP